MASDFTSHRLMEPITLSIQLTTDDLREFNRYVLSNTFRFPGRLVIFVIACVVLGSGMYFKSSQPSIHATPSAAESSSIEEVLPTLVPILIFGGLLYFFVRKGLMNMTYKKHFSDALLPTTLRVTDEGISSENVNANSLNKWAGVRSLAEVKAYYFIMVAPNRGFVVPKRSFATPDAEKAFGSTVRAFLEKNVG